MPLMAVASDILDWADKRRSRLASSAVSRSMSPVISGARQGLDGRRGGSALTVSEDQKLEALSVARTKCVMSARGVRGAPGFLMSWAVSGERALDAVCVHIRSEPGHGGACAVGDETGRQASTFSSHSPTLDRWLGLLILVSNLSVNGLEPELRRACWGVRWTAWVAVSTPRLWATPTCWAGLYVSSQAV